VRSTNPHFQPKVQSKSNQPILLIISAGDSIIHWNTSYTTLQSILLPLFMHWLLALVIRNSFTTISSVNIWQLYACVVAESQSEKYRICTQSTPSCCLIQTGIPPFNLYSQCMYNAIFIIVKFGFLSFMEDRLKGG